MENSGRSHDQHNAAAIINTACRCCCGEGPGDRGAGAAKGASTTLASSVSGHRAVYKTVCKEAVLIAVCVLLVTMTWFCGCRLFTNCKKFASSFLTLQIQPQLAKCC